MEGIKEEKEEEEEIVEDEEPEPPKKLPFWITRAMAEDFSHRHVLKTTLREALVFGIFMAAVMLATSGRRNSYIFHLTSSIKGQFIDRGFNSQDNLITFMDIRSVNDLWSFTTTLMLENLYTEYYYDWHNPVAPAKEDDRKIMFENKLLGVPRIRQVKMRSDSCTVHQLFRRLFTTCFDMYSENNEDKSSFGVGTGTAWVYNENEKTKAKNIDGQIASYAAGGYYQELSTTRNESLKILKDLQEGLWITRGTRVVTIDFSTYNANVNLFSICKFLFEFPPTGGIVPSYKLQSHQLLFYHQRDIVTIVAEAIMYALMFFYMAEELREMQYFKWRYFMQFWTYIDLLILSMTVGSFITSMVIFPRIGTAIKKIVDNPKEYGNLEFFGEMKSLYNTFAASLLFFTLIKLFKYLNFNRTMGQLNNTLKKCVWDIFGFSIMFFTIFCAFAELGYLLFGSQVEDFSGFGVAMFTLLRTILGDFDYVSIERANRFLAPIFFLSYIFLVFFTLLNMFLAIINDSYADVKTEIKIAPDEMQMSEYLYERFLTLCDKLRLNFRFDVLQKGTLSSTLHLITDALKKCGYSDDEIQQFLHKYKIDEYVEDAHFDVKTLIKELESQIESMEMDDRSLVHINDFLSDKQRLNEIEQGVEKVSNKIASLTAKLDALIEARNQKQV